MGKYDRLERHLRRQKATAYEMTFRDIERVLCELLPARARHLDWWANDQDPTPRQVQCGAWLRAGYHAALVWPEERVRFTKVGAVEAREDP